MGRWRPCPHKGVRRAPSGSGRQPSWLLRFSRNWRISPVRPFVSERSAAIRWRSSMTDADCCSHAIRSRSSCSTMGRPSPLPSWMTAIAACLLPTRRCSPLRRSGFSGSSTHAPSPRRVTSPVSCRPLRAVDTVGRCAPTSRASDSWVRRSGRTTPPAVTRPQRSARCQNSSRRRTSTRGLWQMAWTTAWRADRSAIRRTTVARTSGHWLSRWTTSAFRTANWVGSSANHCTAASTKSATSSSASGTSTSPGPSSSMAPTSPAVTSRRSAPSMTRRPMPPSARGSGSQEPASTSMDGATSAARACTSSASSVASARSGSASSSAITVTTPSPAVP